MKAEDPVVSVNGVELILGEVVRPEVKEHCVIDGKRCSKCCEVLILGDSKRLRDCFKYYRRYGYPEDFVGDKIHYMLVEISKRRAKKINPYLVNHVKSGNRLFFKCKNFTGSGCGIYENRPEMCSEFPYYGKTKEEFLTEFNANDNWKPEYTEGCTYYIELK